MIEVYVKLPRYSSTFTVNIPRLRSQFFYWNFSLNSNFEKCYMNHSQSASSSDIHFQSCAILRSITQENPKSRHQELLCRSVSFPSIRKNPKHLTLPMTPYNEIYPIYLNYIHHRSHIHNRHCHFVLLHNTNEPKIERIRKMFVICGNHSVYRMNFL